MATVPAHLTPERVAKRVLDKAELVRDCLVSGYATGSHGYPMVGWYENGTQYNGLAHRIAWASVYGPIPDGLVVHHECFNRSCVNVEHLRLTERWRNSQRRSGDDWPDGTCAAGHSDDEMTYYPTLGKRRCSSCYRQDRARGNAAAQAKRRKERHG